MQKHYFWYEKVRAPVLQCSQPALQILLEVTPALSQLVLGVGGLTGALGRNLCLQVQDLLF